MPRFILRTKDEGEEQTYEDEVNHQIEKIVRQREFRRAAKDLVPYNSVHAMRELPKMVSVEDPSPLQHARYGVAIWRHVDPTTDFFEVDMYGMSNAYRITESADGKLEVADKAVRQQFRRPGDDIDESEREIRLVGNPEWLYLTRESTIEVPNAISVLSNRRDAPQAE